MYIGCIYFVHFCLGHYSVAYTTYKQNYPASHSVLSHDVTFENDYLEYLHCPKYPKMIQFFFYVKMGKHIDFPLSYSKIGGE